MRHCSRLPFDAHAPAAARQKVRALGAAWPAHQLDAALLATSELVTQAVRHGRGPLELSVELASAPPSSLGNGRSAEVLRVEVSDTGSLAARWARSDQRPLGTIDGSRRDPPGADGHRLVVTPAVSSRWGVQDGPGRGTWFEVDRPG